MLELVGYAFWPWATSRQNSERRHHCCHTWWAILNCWSLSSPSCHLTASHSTFQDVSRRSCPIYCQLRRRLLRPAAKFTLSFSPCISRGAPWRVLHQWRRWTWWRWCHTWRYRRRLRQSFQDLKRPYDLQQIDYYSILKFRSKRIKDFKKF